MTGYRAAPMSGFDKSLALIRSGGIHGWCRSRANAQGACSRSSFSKGPSPGCAQEVRSSVRTVGTHSGGCTGSRFALRFAPSYASCCEPGQGLPRWLTRKVTNASGCQALVSTVVARVLQRFPWQPGLLPNKPTEEARRSWRPFTKADGRVGSICANWRAPL